MSGLLFSNMRWAGQDYEVIIDEATREVYVAGARAAERAVEASNSSLSRFLASNSPEALPYKGLVLSQTTYPGKTRRVQAIPLDVIISFWAYLAGKGNNRAKALLEGAAKSNFRDTALAAANIHETGQQKEDALVKNVEIRYQLCTEWGIKYEQGDRDSFYQNATEEEVKLVHAAVHLNRLMAAKYPAKLAKYQKEGWLLPSSQQALDELRARPEVVKLAEEIR